jgi:2-polyprenyl-3-methyl-5-hydroxy-6-metoxy-1,4-benzoquinol methylase
MILKCSDVLEHVVPPVENAFCGLSDLLKPNGVLIFSVPYILDGEYNEFYPK